MTEDPPVMVGGEKLTDAAASPIDAPVWATTFVGACGASSGVTAELAELAAEDPAEFFAVTVKV